MDRIKDADSSVQVKNVGVAGYAEAFLPVQSDLQTSE